MTFDITHTIKAGFAITSQHNWINSFKKPHKFNARNIVYSLHSTCICFRYCQIVNF